MRSVGLLAGVILCAVYCQLTLKVRALACADRTPQGGTAYILCMLSDPLVWTAIVAVGFGAMLWLLVIRSVSLGVAYPVVALAFALVPVAAAIFLHEPLPTSRIIGLVLITIGVALSSSAA